MTVAQKGFVAARYLKLKVDAELDFEKQKNSVKSKSNSKQDISEITPHPELYNRIKYWRDVTAAEMEVPLYRVINLKSIMEATKILPTDKKTLLHVHGFGKKSVEQFGEALLNIVETYCKERNLSTNLLTIAPRKKRIPKRSETKEKSFEFFKEGKTINEIAQIRGLARTTIEGHLGYFVGTGELDIYRIIDEQKVETIQKTLTQYPDAPTSDIKAKLGDNFSYGDIGTVKRYLAYEESKTEDGTVK